MSAYFAFFKGEMAALVIEKISDLNSKSSKSPKPKKVIFRGHTYN